VVNDKNYDKKEDYPMDVIKKALPILLVMFLCFTVLAACDRNRNDKGGDRTRAVSEVQPSGDAGSGETDAAQNEDTKKAKSLPPMTAENITLSYASWENEVLTTHLAKRFMEKYPNITVEVITLPLEGYNDALLNLVASGQMPDAFWILGECDFAIANQLLGDMTEYWENDPESDNVLKTINEGRFGYYGTDRKWATPVKFFPETIFANKALFEQLNVEMPPMDWTWEEMVEYVKKMTVPELGIYGFNQYRRIVTWYPVAADDNCWGEFGWDGQSFDFTNWADGINLEAELINGGYHAPPFGSDEAEKAFGDRNMWAADSGKIAFQFDAWWTFNNLFAQDKYLEKGLIYVPYLVPRAKGTTSKHTMGTLDFGGISSATEYPREAYELLKFMNWSEEGWMAKLEAYSTLTNPDGSRLSLDALPITLSEKVWQEVRKFFPGDDDPYGRGPWFDYFLEHCKEPIPYGGTMIPGFATFLAEGYAGVEDAVINGGVNAHDFVRDLTEKANAANREAMKAFETYE
jgi:multiple sugar transport system substrate-binding protein